MEDIRQAVGIFVVHESDWLMIEKIKRMDADETKMESRWDIVKGGVEPGDDSLEVAALRELVEETGSDAYTIEESFDEPISFSYPHDVAEEMGYDGQSTHMFLATFQGDAEDLDPDEKEIGSVAFFDRDTFVEKIPFNDVRQYYLDHID